MYEVTSLRQHCVLINIKCIAINVRYYHEIIPSLSEIFMRLNKALRYKMCPSQFLKRISLATN